MVGPWPLRFQDADFPRKLLWWWSQEEGLHQRWTPYGMPRLGPTFERSVFFLYRTDPKTGKREAKSCGTGVLVGLDAESSRASLYNIHFYAVSCHHVVVTGGAGHIRVNTKEGKHRYIDTDLDDWQWISNHDDLAALDVTERLDWPKDTISYIPQRLFVTREFVSTAELGIGEDGFMLGLFADLPGERRNLVAARFGNLSLLAADDVLIKQGNDKRRPSHIFDIRSRPGFSGSPVFIYRTPTGDLRDGVDFTPPPPPLHSFVQAHMLPDPRFINPYNANLEAAKNQFIRFLGIHTAQYHDTVTAHKVRTTLAESDEIRHGDKLKIPNSMTVVAPAWEILRLLDLPVFKNQRKERERTMIERKESGPNEPEPESTEPTSGPSDENPRHREDFNSLVSAAARKKKPTDQT